MTRILSILFTLNIALGLQAQIVIRSGDVSVIDIDTSQSPLSEFPSKTTLKTTSVATNNRFAQFKLYVLREEAKVSLNLTMKSGEVPDKIVIERKSSNQLSEYRSIKEFSKDDLYFLAKNGKVLFEDKYPEPSKIDCYYRVVSQYNDEVIKFTAPVLLLGQTSKNNSSLTFGDHEEDISLFKDEFSKYAKSDLRILVDRIDGDVVLTLVGGANLQENYIVSVERMSNEKMPLYRPIKELNTSELNELINIGLLSINDKYPASSKFSSFYRIVVRKDGQVIETTDPMELPRLQ